MEILKKEGFNYTLGVVWLIAVYAFISQFTNDAGLKGGFCVIAMLASMIAYNELLDWVFRSGEKDEH